jgi:hypothetical protein
MCDSDTLVLADAKVGVGAGVDTEVSPARIMRQRRTVKSLDPVTRLLASANAAHVQNAASTTWTTCRYYIHMLLRAVD